MPQVLRPVDVVAAVRISSLVATRREWACQDLGHDLGVSTSTAYLVLDRCRRAQLVLPSGQVSRERLRDTLLYVVPLVYPASYEGPGQGTPTAASAPYSSDAGMFEKRPEVPLVWPSVQKVRGVSVLPLHPSVPELAARDALLYELLALADVMRVGSEQDKLKAARYVGQRLGVADRSRREP